jgi:microcystin-dependent protein
MKKNKINNVGEEKIVSARAITLITLVITIVILIILAGITINLALGDNGIFSTAKQAKEQYLNVQTTEEDELNNLYSEILVATGDDSKITISVEDLRSLIQEEIKKSNESSVPAGTVISYIVGNEAPSGYLKCDGTIYNISDYQTLADAIKDGLGSYNYYGGDGETTFAVPNLQGEFLRGYSTGSTASKTSGVTTANVGLHQDATNVKSGAWTTGSSSSDTRIFQYGTSGSSVVSFADVTTMTTSRVCYSTTGRATESFNGVSYYTTRPTNTSVLYCIKY